MANSNAIFILREFLRDGVFRSHFTRQIGRPLVMEDCLESIENRQLGEGQTNYYPLSRLASCDFPSCHLAV